MATAADNTLQRKWEEQKKYTKTTLYGCCMYLIFYRPVTIVAEHAHRLFAVVKKKDQKWC